ncbi:MAG: hypothetical protein IT181_05395 [Acidobacteria bacterium]|nr:hypothetical protein [Acidobacteriota bacterium]
MTPCLTPDEFVDLVDGTLAAGREAHLADCAACAATATDVREALAAAMSAEVPEPSPLFWPSVNARVQAAVAESAATGWRAWLRLDVLVPIAGLALVVVAIASAVDGLSPGGRIPTGPDVAVADGPVEFASEAADDAPAAPAATDDALAMVADLASALPEGGWDALGVTRLPDLDIAAAALSVEERDALAALLQSAVERPKS